MSAGKGGCRAAVRTDKPTTHSSSSSFLCGGGGETGTPEHLLGCCGIAITGRQGEQGNISPQRSQVRETNDWIVLIQRSASDWAFLSNRHSGKTQGIQKA